MKNKLRGGYQYLKIIVPERWVQLNCPYNFNKPIQALNKSESHSIDKSECEKI